MTRTPVNDSHPLKSFMSSENSHPNENNAETPYYTFYDYPWDSGGRKYHVRMHRFLTGRESKGIKPVFGLTA